MLKIDEELRSLIPPLSEEEYETLKASIVNEGVREALVVTTEDVIVDGHNRYEIAMDSGFNENDLPIERRYFADQSEIMVWMIDNQRGRRNLTKQAWLDLGFKRAELLKPRAAANKGARTDLSQKSDTGSEFEPVDTLQEAADYAGVSRDTAAKYKRVMSDAPEDVQQAVRTGEKSINKAYQETTKPKPREEPEEIVHEVVLDDPLTEEDQEKEGKRIAYRAIDRIAKDISGVTEIVRKSALSEIKEWIEGVE